MGSTVPWNLIAPGRSIAWMRRSNAGTLNVKEWRMPFW